MLFVTGGMSILMGLLAEIIMRTYYESQGKAVYWSKAPPTSAPAPPEMCGLAGFVGAGTVDDLRAMGAAIVHRGPDGEGIEVDAARGLHLLHRRLAVVDIEGGALPMWNAERSVGVIFNGEIYNHLELRATLMALGHHFRSDHSDTEVLVHDRASLEGWLAGHPRIAPGTT